MRSDPNDVPAMADETRERALHHAMLVEVAIRAQDQPELWLTAAELALSAQGAAMMTLNSALAKTCAKYRTEHEKAGCINPDDDNPGATICNHQCGQCETLQSMARAIDTTMGNIHRERIRNDRPVSPKQLQEIKNLHNLLLGQVHLAAGLAPEHAESFGQTKSRILRRAAQEQGMEVTEIQVSGKTLAEEQKDNRNPQPPHTLHRLDESKPHDRNNDRQPARCGTRSRDPLVFSQRRAAEVMMDAIPSAYRLCERCWDEKQS